MPAADRAVARVAVPWGAAAVAWSREAVRVELCSEASGCSPSKVSRVSRAPKRKRPRNPRRSREESRTDRTSDSRMLLGEGGSTYISQPLHAGYSNNGAIFYTIARGASRRDP